MEGESDQKSWLPWIIAAVAVFLLLRNQQSEQKPAKSAITAVVRTTFPTIREAYRSAFLEAAKKIESKEITNQEQWTKHIADNAGAKQKEALNRVYEAIDALDLPADFAGKEKEIAEINRKIGGAW